MALSIVVTHDFVSVIDDDPVAEAAGEVTPSRWNEQHNFALGGAANHLLGFDAGGNGAEVAVSTGLSLVGGNLTCTITQYNDAAAVAANTGFWQPVSANLTDWAAVSPTNYYTKTQADAAFDATGAAAAVAATIPEVARDTLGTALVAGAGISITPNDGADTITIAGTVTQYTDEMAQDAANSLIQNGTGITWSYNDVANTLTPTVSLAAFSTTNLSEGSNLYFTDERAQDAVGTILTDSTTIDFTYNDAGGSITAIVKDASVAYAKIQDVSATKRALGRNTAGAGSAEEVTAEQLLDWIGAPAQGDILYRGSAATVRLAAGTNKQFLTTQGASANPKWDWPVRPYAAHISGNYFLPLSYGGSAPNNGASPSAANRAYLVPLWVDTPETVKGVAVHVNTGAGATNLQIAIYAGNIATGHPTSTVLASTGNMATTSSSTTVTSTFAGSATVNLVPGNLYFMLFNFDNTSALITAQAQHNPLAWMGVAGTSMMTNNGTIVLNMYTPLTFGTWSDLTSATFTEDNANAQRCYVALLQVN